MFLNSIQSNVFGNGNGVIESVLKNPNQYRDAVLYESLASLTQSKLNEFVDSDEAKMMIDKELISQDTLERLANEHKNSLVDTTVCHMAKENGDPMWDELVKLRIEERRVMNELIDKYSDQAKPVVDNAQTDFIEACIPEYFRV